MKLTSIVQDKSRNAAAMTVRAQAVAATNPDNNRFGIFYTRQDAQSMRMSEMTSVNFRFVAERRPYNTRGIEMPEKFGPMREFIFLPIQVKKTIDEEEIQALGVPTDNERMVLELLGTTIPQRIDGMTLADYRRLEFDCLQAWATGLIYAKNYNTKVTALVSFGFAADRHEVAATAWDDAGVNAWDEFVAWARAKKAQLGSLEGVYLSGSALEVIREDAPTNQVTGLPLGDGELAQLVASQIGGTFRFVVDDRVADVPVEAGTAGRDDETGTLPTRYWPIGAVAAIPQGLRIGEVRFAPVIRATDVVAQVPNNKASVRDVAVIYVPNDDGTNLEIQVQLNAYPALNEQRVGVIDIGITE